MGYLMLNAQNKFQQQSSQLGYITLSKHLSWYAIISCAIYNK